MSSPLGRSALAHQSFRRYLAGQTISQLGTKMQSAALLWHLYTLTRSPIALGAFGIAKVLPIVLLTLVGGVVADRVDRRRMLIRTQLAMAILALGLAATTWAGVGGAWPIYAVAFLSGTVQAFDSPTRQSLLPNLVPEAALTSAIGLDALAQKAAKVLGPLLMVPLLAGPGPAAVYLANGLSYVAVIGALVGLGEVGGPGKAKGKGGLAEIAEGLRHVRAAPVLGPLLAMDFAASFFGTVDTMLPIFAAEVLALDASGYGLLAAAAPAGAVIGSIGASLAGEVRAPWRRAVQVTLLYGAAIAAFGLSRSLPVAMLTLALASGADTVGTILRNTVRHTTTPDALRGRVASLNTLLAKAGPQLGEMQAGLLASALGVGSSIALGGAVCTGFVLGFARLAARRGAAGQPGGARGDLRPTKKVP